LLHIRLDVGYMCLRL